MTVEKLVELLSKIDLTPTAPENIDFVETTEWGEITHYKNGRCTVSIK